MTIGGQARKGGGIKRNVRTGVRDGNGLEGPGKVRQVKESKRNAMRRDPG